MKKFEDSNFIMGILWFKTIILIGLFLFMGISNGCSSYKPLTKCHIYEDVIKSKNNNYPTVSKRNQFNPNKKYRKQWIILKRY